MAVLILIGGPERAGKTTLAQAWADSRRRGVLIDVKKVLDQIRGGFVDPQAESPERAAQFDVGVRATVAMARVFLKSGYDVAIEEIFTLASFAQWSEPLSGLDWRMLILRPSLAEIVERSRGLTPERLQHVRSQHEAMGRWPDTTIIDTTGLSVAQSVALIEQRLRDQPIQLPEAPAP